MRICKTLGEDLQGFARLWKTWRICENFGILEDLWDFGRLGEDL